MSRLLRMLWKKDVARAFIVSWVVAATVSPVMAHPMFAVDVFADNRSFGGFNFDHERVVNSDEPAAAIVTVLGGIGKAFAQPLELGGFAQAAGAHVEALAAVEDIVTFPDPTPATTCPPACDEDSGYRLNLALSGNISPFAFAGSVSVVGFRDTGTIPIINTGIGFPYDATARQQFGLGSEIGDPRTVPLNRPGGFESFVLPVGTYDLLVLMHVSVHGTGIVNYFDTLSISIETPDGTPFSSEHGLFLSLQQEPPSGAPEPTTLSLMTAALVSWGVMAWRRRRHLN
jgi:PEP-CTERM motif-containing protein